MFTHQITYAIGGLENVGFAPQSDICIILSTQGQGIFNTLKGLKIARNHSEWWEKFNQADNTIQGFDILENVFVKTSGLHGDDNLLKQTTDGWKLSLSAPMPDAPPFQDYTIYKIILTAPDGTEKYIAQDGACELRAFGFSETGNSLIVALSCELIIFTKQTEL